MTTTVVFECESFEVMVEGQDIVLQGLLRDIVLTDAYYDLRENVIHSEKREYYDGNGISIDYDTDRVNDIVNDSLADYALSIAHSGSVINHNCN